ncbi:uncharacterized protein LOC133806534 [Humulus lupulus]|uniref:uncharacterized protein LOC133806534 n=1 Tax=Humulus lupulus TaxID=3486 RepID=UPI002B40CCFE|nr:uncharacterized protein LOC133806534 [Humulus lupulus]
MRTLNFNFPPLLSFSLFLFLSYSRNVQPAACDHHHHLSLLTLSLSLSLSSTPSPCLILLLSCTNGRPHKRRVEGVTDERQRSKGAHEPKVVEDGRRRVQGSRTEGSKGWRCVSWWLISLAQEHIRKVFWGIKRLMTSNFVRQVAGCCFTNKEGDAHIPNYPNLPPQLICQLHIVTMHGWIKLLKDTVLQF